MNWSNVTRMKKVALVFVLAVFVPSLVLAWLGTNTARTKTSATFFILVTLRQFILPFFQMDCDRFCHGWFVERAVGGKLAWNAG